jgi:lambda family phage tail tape measure protein
MPVNVGQIVISLGANTAQFSLEMTRAEQLAAAKGGQIQGTLARLSGSARAWGQATHEAGQHAVTGVQATSGALRVLEGNMTNNLRAAERFIANTLGMGNALKAAFPVVGAIAMGGILFELKDKAEAAYETFKKMQEAPQRIAESFHGIAQPIAVANDELRVSNDRLENEIAKLEGKRENGLKLELDEARLASDKLSESLRKNVSEIAKLLQSENISSLKSLFTGQASTSDIRDKIVGERGYGGYKLQIEETAAKYDAQLHEVDPNSKNAASQRRAIEDQKYAEVQKILGEALAYVNGELKKRTDLQNSIKEYNGKIDGKFAPDGSDLPDDQSAAIAQLRGVQSVFREMQANYSLSRTNSGLEGVVGALKADHANAAQDNPLKNKLTELRAELTETQSVAQSAGKSIFDEALAKGAGEAAKAIAEVNTQLREHNQKPLGLGAQSDITALETQIALTKAVGKAEDEQAKKLQEDSAELQRSLDAEALKTAQTIATIREETSATEALTKARQMGAQAIFDADEATKLAKISDPDERSAQQALDQAKHADSIAAKVDQIKQQTAAIRALTAAENEGRAAKRAAEMSNIDNDNTLDPDVKAAMKEQLQARNDQEDTQRMIGLPATDGIRKYFQDFRDSAKSTAQDVEDVLGKAFDGINDQLARMVDGQKVSWGSFFKMLSDMVTKMALTGFEGQIGRLFNVGGGNSSSGGFGGFFASLFGGFRASGGAVDGDKSYIVGENGPELFTPPSGGGSIVPNHKLGGSVAYYTIDARGANAADVEARIHRSLVAVHGQAVKNAVAVQQEFRARGPRGKY